MSYAPRGMMVDGHDRLPTEAVVPSRALIALRSAAALAAVTLGGLAYRHHSFADHDERWWWWLVDLAVALALTLVALGPQDPTQERRGRRVARAVAGLGALGLGTVAFLLVPIHGREAAAALAVVGTVVLFGLSRWRPLTPSDRRWILPSEDGRRGRRSALGLVVSLLGAATVGAAIYTNESHHLAALVLWALGLAVFATGQGILSAPKHRSDDATEPHSDPHVGPALRSTTEWLLVAMILAGAVALRLFAIGDVPTWIDSDEGRLTYWAAEKWRDGFPNAFGLGWNSFPHLTYLLHYLGVQFLGPSNTNVRIVSAAVGVLSLVPVYFFARRWWGGYVALVAMALLAMNQEHLYWSRVGFNNIDAVLIGGLVLATLGRALTSGRPVDWVWVGLSLGLGFHTYHAAKLFPWLIALALLPLFIGTRGTWRAHRWGIGVALLAMVLTIAPQFVSIWRQWDSFLIDTSNRNNVHLLLDAFAAGDVTAVRNHFRVQVLHCLYVFLSMPYRQPVLDAATATPFLLGFGWMLWRWRDPRHTVVLAWIIGILVVGGMMTDYPPSKQRMLGMMVAVCVVPAVLAGRLRGLLHALLGRRAFAVVAVLTIAWLGFALYGNWHTHFVHQADRMRGDVMTNICKRILAAERPLTVYTIGPESISNPRQIERDCTLPPDPERFDVIPSTDRDIVPLPPHHRGGALITIPRSHRDVVPLLLAFYPRAKFEIVRGHDDGEDLYLLTLTRPQVEEMRGLIASFRDTEGHTRIGKLPNRFPPPNTGFPLDTPEGALAGTTVRWFGHIQFPAAGLYEVRFSDGTVAIDGHTAPAGIEAIPGWAPIEVQAPASAPRQREIEWRLPGSSEWSRVPREHLYAGGSVPRLRVRRFAGSIDDAGPAPLAAPAQSEFSAAAIFTEWSAHEVDPDADAVVPLDSTVEWSGFVHLTPGAAHTLRVLATNPTRVFVDGELVVETAGAAHGPAIERALPDVSGWVPITVRSLRSADADRFRWGLRLSWAPLGGVWSTHANYAITRPTEVREPAAVTSSPADQAGPADGRPEN